MRAKLFWSLQRVHIKTQRYYPDSKGMLAQRTKVGWQVGRSLRLGKWRWANIALVDHYQSVIESWNDDFTPSLV